MNTATITVTAGDFADAHEQACKWLTEFFGDFPYVISDVTSEARMTGSGHPLFWECVFDAELEGTPNE